MRRAWLHASTQNAARPICLAMASETASSSIDTAGPPRIRVFHPVLEHEDIAGRRRRRRGARAFAQVAELDESLPVDAILRCGGEFAPTVVPEVVFIDHDEA